MQKSLRDEEAQKQVIKKSRNLNTIKDINEFMWPYRIVAKK